MELAICTALPPSLQLLTSLLYAHVIKAIAHCIHPPACQPLVTQRAQVPFENLDQHSHPVFTPNKIPAVPPRWNSDTATLDPVASVRKIAVPTM